MRKILLIGASIEAISLLNSKKFEIVGIIDINLKINRCWNGIKVFNSEDEAVNLTKTRDVCVAIDNTKNRERAFTNLRKNKFNLISIHDGYLAKDVEIGEGYYLQRFTNLSEGSKIGEGLRMNIGANVMHNALIGNYVTIAPNAVVLGNIKIGNYTYVGANATILPNIEIGSNVTIGAGSVVTKNIKSNKIVKGNPAL